MHKKFQMNSIRELTFFLGLQVLHRDDGIFISQDKYVVDILKKFNFSSVKTTSTPIETNKALLTDKEAKDVDVHLYRSMIGSLMYLTASRPDIMFDVCDCLWYSKDSPFNLEAFSDSDYAGASLDSKSIKGGCQFLGKRLISWQCKKQTVVANSTTKVEYVATANCCGQMALVMNLELKLAVAKVSTTEQKLVLNGCLNWNETAANDEIQVSVVGLTYYCTMAFAIICLATNQKFNFSKYIFDNMMKQLDSGVKFLMYLRCVKVFLDNQVKDMDRHNETFVISSYIKKVFANMKREGKDFSGKVTPLFQSMMVQALEDMGKGLKIPTDPHHTPIVTQPSSSLLQKKQKSRRKQRKEIKVSSPSSEIPNEKGLPITSNDLLPSEITLVEDTQGRMNEEDMFRVNDLDGDEVNTVDPVTTAGEVVTTVGIEVTTAATTPQISKDELILAQTLIEIKLAKPKSITTAATTVTASGTRTKEKGIVMQEPSETPSPKQINSSQKPLQAKDKGKGKMMQAKLEEEDRLARLKKEETNIDLDVKWDKTQAMVDWIEAFVPMDTEKIAEGIEKAIEGSEKAKESSSKRAGSNLEQEDAKRQRIEEENESAELKRCLEIIP
nr:ribonuclease H-like domain, reverse transcriptase, RNA-dependent DNA polymerase [Tanacetum cinerariifolium]